MRKKHVTIVNDEPSFLHLMSDFLGDEGYHVTAIPKHQVAFEQIKQSKPDLIICDLIFGGEAEGIGLVDMLYFDPETRSIPLIVCSADIPQVRDISPSLEAKGIRWLEKPFEFERLLAMIDSFERSPAASVRDSAMPDSTLPRETRERGQKHQSDGQEDPEKQEPA